MVDQSRRMEGKVRVPFRVGSEAQSTDDAVRLYLKEIGRVPLLDAAEEVWIATRIRSGGDRSGDTRRTIGHQRTARAR